MKRFGTRHWARTAPAIGRSLLWGLVEVLALARTRWRVRGLHR